MTAVSSVMALVNIAGSIRVRLHICITLYEIIVYVTANGLKVTHFISDENVIYMHYSIAYS